MWELYGKKFESRFLLGTARYPSLEILRQSILASQVEIVTVSLRRQSPEKSHQRTFWDVIQSCNVTVLPNTAGCRSVKEAVSTAHMARELFDTTWIKLEVIGNEHTLQPDPFGLVEATRTLAEEGFSVFPYTTEDLVLAERLLHAGANVIMPWGSPIGSGRGLQNEYALKTLRSHLPDVPLVLDAGIGLPSHATQAMEIGFDGVLLNSAVAQSDHPPLMASAFAKAIESGREAFQSGLMVPKQKAQPSTPTLGTPFWHEAKRLDSP